MTPTIPISRFRRLLFAVLQAVTPARAPAAAHAQLAVHERAERIALHAFELAVPHVQQKPA